MQQSPIFTKTYDLLLWLIPATTKFPRELRFVLARAVQETALRFQETLIEAGLASGHYDVDLSERGRREAGSKRLRLLRLGADMVYTSDLKRAYETAEIVFRGTRIPIIRDARLRECDYGGMTRRPRSEVFDARGNAISTPYPNGESYNQVVERIGSFLDYIASKYVGKVLIIGHFATLVGLEYWLNSRSIQDSFKIDYIEIGFPLQYSLDAISKPICIE